MKKIQHVSCMQSMGILLVVVGHALPPEGFMIIPNFAIFLKKVIYSFHMPLFMFLAGVVFINFSKKEDYFTFIKKKALRLIVPYIFFITFTTILKGIFSEFAANPIQLNIELLVHSILFPGSAVIVNYWFLATLFCIFITSPFSRKIYAANTDYALITIALIVLNIYNPLSNMQLFSINMFFDLLIYFWLGCMAVKYYSSISNALNSIYTFAVSIILLCVLNFFDRHILLEISFIKAVVGIAVMWSLSMFYIESKYTFIDFLNGKNYSIYLLHGVIGLFIGSLLKGLSSGFYWYFVIVTLTSMLIPVACINVIKYLKLDNKVVKALLGL